MGETAPAIRSQRQEAVSDAAHMAPEQLEGASGDERTDIFAFGAVLYEMASGKRAFRGDSQASLIAAILNRQPEPPRDRSVVSSRTYLRLWIGWSANVSRKIPTRVGRVRATWPTNCAGCRRRGLPGLLPSSRSR